MVIVRVKRGDSRKSYWQTYELRGVVGRLTVLELLIYIRERIDPTLGISYSCRMGLCGACAMKINGKPRLACQTPLSEVLDGDELTVEPLDKGVVVKDLIVSTNQ